MWARTTLMGLDVHRQSKINWLRTVVGQRLPTVCLTANAFEYSCVLCDYLMSYKP